MYRVLGGKGGTCGTDQQTSDFADFQKVEPRWNLVELLALRGVQITGDTNGC